jgi:hypothetical protein
VTLGALIFVLGFTPIVAALYMRIERKRRDIEFRQQMRSAAWRSLARALQSDDTYL